MKEGGSDANCECDHLTNFVILTDTGAGDEMDIQVFTIIGVGAVFMCTVIVLISVLISRYVSTVDPH